MPDEIVAPAPAGVVAAPAAPPVAQPAVAAAPAPAPVAPAAPAPAVQSAASAVEPPGTGQPEPTWLKSRLEQAKSSARQAALAELGVADLGAAKLAIAAANKAAEDEKALGVRLAERDAALLAATTRATALEQTVKARADLELAGLTDVQRAAVAAVAGDDSARVLSAIDALKPTWGSAPATQTVATPVVAPTTPVAPAPVAPAPAATTSPPPTAPGSATGSPPNRKAEYEALKKTSGVAAAAYLNRYERDIYPRP